MSIALIGYMEEEVAAGRMDPKAAFGMLAKNSIEELELWERQYDEAISLCRQAGLKICEQRLAAMDAKEREDALLRTIFQTWSYLGRYISDRDDATHAKRLLQNCLLVRGPEGMKAAVKKRVLAPKRRRLFSVMSDYVMFALFLYLFGHDLATANYGMAFVWLAMVIWSVVDIAKEAAKGGKHVQA